MLDRFLDENQFLSEYGLRSLSKYHADHPFSIDGLLENKYGTTLPIHIAYEPGRSLSNVFGSVNSNWRGPIWVQMNYLFIDMLRTRAQFQREQEVKRPIPTFGVRNETGNPGNRIEDRKSYLEIANVLANRILNLFRLKNTYRACHSQNDQFLDFFRCTDEFRSESEVNETDLVLFYEFFHGEHGAGLGASHQSWTTIVANIMKEMYS